MGMLFIEQNIHLMLKLADVYFCKTYFCPVRRVHLSMSDKQILSFTKEYAYVYNI